MESRAVLSFSTLFLVFLGSRSAVGSFRAVVFFFLRRFFLRTVVS